MVSGHYVKLFIKEVPHSAL